MIRIPHGLVTIFLVFQLIADTGAQGVKGKSLEEMAFEQLIISAAGTGKTTGRIASVTVTNNSSTVIRLVPQEMYIPSDGTHQSYVGRIPNIIVQPGSTVSLPVNGYCADPRKPAMASGDIFDPKKKWIAIRDPQATPSLVEPGITPVHLVPAIVPRFQGATPEIEDKVTFTPLKPRGNKPLPEPQPFIATWPGTETPLGGTFNPDKDPEVFAPIIIDVLSRLEKTVKEHHGNADFDTPFAPKPDLQDTAVIQHTLWRWASSATGEDYEKSVFAVHIYDQMKANIGSPVLAPDVKEKADIGIDNFWTVFAATGVEAKVLKANEAYSDKNAAPIAPPVTCLTQGVDPAFNTRYRTVAQSEFFDLLGGLYRKGKISVNPYDAVRNTFPAQLVHAKELLVRMDAILEYPNNPFACPLKDGDRSIGFVTPQPTLDFVIEVCDKDNLEKDRIMADFLDESKGDPYAAVNQWYDGLRRRFDIGDIEERADALFTTLQTSCNISYDRIQLRLGPGELNVLNARLAQEQPTPDLVLPLAMLNDDTWKTIRSDLSGAISEDHLANLDGIREELKNSLNTLIGGTLCTYRAVLRNHIHSMEVELNPAFEYTSTRHWADLWKAHHDEFTACCCEQSDGKSSANCVVKISSQ